MYTRSYHSEEEKIKVPENYDGNALREEVHSEEIPLSLPLTKSIGETKISPREDIPRADDEKECEECFTEPKTEEAAVKVGIFERLSQNGIFKKRFGGLLKLDGFKIGSEEILIAAVALFLLFSKDGDLECAIMLLLLLFVN